MTETSDSSWKTSQNVKDFAESSVKKIKLNEENIWVELKEHPSWNNLFVLLENCLNRCAELEKKSREKRYDDDTTMKNKGSIRKKYKKYKKRYKLIKSEVSRTSDSGYECTPRN